MTYGPSGITPNEGLADFFQAFIQSVLQIRHTSNPRQRLLLSIQTLGVEMNLTMFHRLDLFLSLPLVYIREGFFTDLS